MQSGGRQGGIVGGVVGFVIRLISRPTSAVPELRVPNTNASNPASAQRRPLDRFSSVRDRLTQLDARKTEGLLSDVEYATNRQAILSDL